MHGSPTSSRNREYGWSSTTASTAPARLTRYWDQLAEVRATNPAIGTDCCVRRPSLGNASPGTGEASFESLRHRMRQEKFGFIDAETKVVLQQGLKEGLPLADGNIETRREDAKRQNKEIKASILQEKEAQLGLQQTLAEVVQEAQGAYNAAVRELEELEMTHKDYSLMGGDLTDTGSLIEDLVNSSQSLMAGQNLEETKSGMNALMRLQSALQEEKKHRQALEAEALRLEAELGHVKEESSIQQKHRDQECQMVSKMEALHKAVLDLGLPEITFDEARGTVVLDGVRGGARVQLAEEALRTVEVEFGKDGKLIRAMPHQKLGLQNEATDAVQLDDLPRLLTSVWHRLCCNDEKPKGHRRSRGGA